MQREMCLWGRINQTNKQTKTAALKAKGYRKSLNLATNHQDGNTT